jgi:hypothetical protein
MPQDLEKQAKKVLLVMAQDHGWYTLRDLHRATHIKYPDLELALGRLGMMVQSRRAWGGLRNNGDREVVRQWRVAADDGEA